MSHCNRREFLARAATGAVGLNLAGPVSSALAQIAGARPRPMAEGVKVLNPAGRVPVSLIIDDSTCLVNLAHFGIPQFAEVFPDQYRQPWRTLPREIPDAFVRKFGEWSQDQGVKGKYSIVPYPACVGWVDREMPGWSRRELEESVNLVRTLMVPNWDIHPEMITHTRVIDTKTGRPYPEHTDRFMENWRWTDGKSVDQLADYMSYALRILKNAGLPCQGITTPGGFGNRVLPELAQATLQSCRDVFQAEVPHYFRHLFTDDQSVAPRVEYASGLDGPDPRCVVSMIGCTGDWFGGWDGLEAGSADRCITEDLKGGRLPAVIARGEPAVLVCHWPGIYFNGQETGFNILKQVVGRLRAAYGDVNWMKLGDIARYWAARELTSVERHEQRLLLRAPFATNRFTVQVNAQPQTDPMIATRDLRSPLREVRREGDLRSGTWLRGERTATFCFDLARGESEIRF